MSNNPTKQSFSSERRHFIGGSDARVIMGSDEKALRRLWQQKRGEIGELDLSGELVVQLGVVTEDLNRRWFEKNAGVTVTFPVRAAASATAAAAASTSGTRDTDARRTGVVALRP